VKRMAVEKPRRILIRGTNWVGDAVMSIPAMREIRRIFPEARISLLVKPWVRDVYSTAEYLDEILNYDKSGAHAGWHGILRLASDLRARHFDMAILLQNAFEAAWIVWLARIPVRIGYARSGRSFLLTHACKIDPGLRDLHQVCYYLGLLSSSGLRPPQFWNNPGSVHLPSIGTTDADRTSAKLLLRENGIREGDILVGLNPGASYGGAKRWLPERFAAVADGLADRYRARIIVIGSESDRLAAAETASKMKHTSVVLAGRTTLGQLMGLLEEFHLFITNDSGPMHLAAALGVPQLAIFGSTSATATGPLHPQSKVIQKPVECNPCFLRECPIDFRCMKRITVEDVLAEAEAKLDLGRD
jgi:heptosyltransferase II